MPSDRDLLDVPVEIEGLEEMAAAARTLLRDLAGVMKSYRDLRRRRLRIVVTKRAIPPEGPAPGLGARGRPRKRG